MLEDRLLTFRTMKIMVAALAVVGVVSYGVASQEGRIRSNWTEIY